MKWFTKSHNQYHWSKHFTNWHPWKESLQQFFHILAYLVVSAVLLLFLNYAVLVVGLCQIFPYMPFSSLIYNGICRLFSLRQSSHGAFSINLSSKGGNWEQKVWLCCFSPCAFHINLFITEMNDENVYLLSKIRHTLREELNKLMAKLH